MEFSLMLSLLATVVLTTIVIWLVGSMSSTFVVSDLGAAVLVAMAMMALGWLTAGPVQAVASTIQADVAGPPPAPAESEQWTAAQYVHAGVRFVRNILLLAIVGLFAPGVTIRGMLGLLIASALLTVLESFPVQPAYFGL